MTLYIQLFREIVSFLGWRLVVLLVLMVAVGLTEGLSIALLLPLLSHIGIYYAAGQGAANVMLNRGLSAIEASFPGSTFASTRCSRSVRNAYRSASWSASVM